MSDTHSGEAPQVPPFERDGDAQPFYAYPGKKDPTQPNRKKPNRVGCFLMSLFTVFLVSVLVVIGLFLPPINLGERLFGVRYVQLDSINNAIALTSPSGGNDFTLILNPDDIGQGFGVSLSRLSQADFFATANTTSESWIPLARATLPRGMMLKSDLFSIDSIGTSPQTITLLLSLPEGITNPDLIDLYAWDETRSVWEFIPARHTNAGGMSAQTNTLPRHVALFEAQATPPIIATVLESGQTLPSQYPDMVNIVMPVGMTPTLPTNTSPQTVIGNVVGGFELGAMYRVMPVIRNFTDPRAIDVDTVIRLISNPDLQAQHIAQLASFANGGGYSGLFIDYREIPADYRAPFTAFIQNLGRAFNGLNLRLGVIVPAAETQDGRWETGAYDWRAIGTASDFVQIHFIPNPTTFANGRDRLVEAMTRWAIGEVSRTKLLAGLSALPIRETNGNFLTIRYDEAFTLLGDVKIDPPPMGVIAQGQELRLSLSGADALLGMDTTLQTPFLDYIALDGSAIARVWLTTNSALRFRMENFRPFAIAGIGFADLLSSGTMEGTLQTVSAYKRETITEPDALELSLRWRIEGSGTVIDEFVTTIGETIAVTLVAPDGNYAVNVDVVTGDSISPRRGVSVALAQPTITPTLMPFSTPRPFPTPTPTLIAIVPTQPPEAQIVFGTPVGGGGSALRPGAGSILRGFEYGGHVTSTSSQRAVSAMRSAGMTWMKVQVRYGIGGGITEAAEAIRMAHSNGFKVLLGLVGFPSQMNDLQSYISQFARWAGDIAALGPEAIEVWNEPNLDREWARQHLSAANFTALLRATYIEIKTRNPNVTVIAGAPAPTGAELAFPGQVINDDRFLREMVGAGAINYMDCMGVHYNEGIVPPRVTSGDPRGDSYTRYLPALLDTYWSILGGRVPLCITELGYVTPQGYGALPVFFAWGNNTTVEQQATWLAGALSYASQTGRVRLFIVWNIDFTNYDANDPMAGYAIIRPDGSCPACSAIANAR